MKDFFILIAHLLSTLVKLAQPGGLRTVVAESLALKHQLIVINRTRQRAPRLTPWDRLLFGLYSFFVPLRRLRRIAVVLKPAMFLRFYKALQKAKYRWLFSSSSARRPGPKGPSKDLIAVVVEMKRRNPRWGCPRIALQIAHAFGIEINKDVVRRILAQYSHSERNDSGPSWLLGIGHAKDKLWSVELFCCESILLCTYHDPLLNVSGSQRSTVVLVNIYIRNVLNETFFAQKRYPL
jgi:hypothetical protein